MAYVSRRFDMNLQRAERLAYCVAVVLAVYMPLHILLSQSLSLLTGGLEVWKAAKDVLFVLFVPFLLVLAVRQGGLKSRFFRLFLVLGGIYVLLHVLFLLFDSNADPKSAVVASVYNTRPLGFLLLGFVESQAENAKVYIRNITKIMLVMSGIVATLGVLQYFLPKDLLTHIGYSIERGVKPLFFIDDKPDFPRVMSTLRDPNSLGAFLVVPIVYTWRSLIIGHQKKNDRTLMSRQWLRAILVMSSFCMVLTFSRSGWVAVAASIVTLIIIVTKEKAVWRQKYLPIAAVCMVIAFPVLYVVKDTYVAKNLLTHADEKTIQQDPNELRYSLGKKVVRHIVTYPLGEGPGTAGLVSISNPKGTQLTENYYLQIAYELGIVGVGAFLAIYTLVLWRLYKMSIYKGNSTQSVLGVVVLCCGVGIGIFSLLNHSWSNEALAYQWWLLAGLCVARAGKLDLPV